MNVTSHMYVSITSTPVNMYKMPKASCKQRKAHTASGEAKTLRKRTDPYLYESVKSAPELDNWREEFGATE